MKLEEIKSAMRRISQKGVNNYHSYFIKEQNLEDNKKFQKFNMN